MGDYTLHHGHAPSPGPEPARTLWCEICRKAFADMPQYVDHLKSHIANQIGLFNCGACNGVCRNPEHLKAMILSGPTSLPPPPPIPPSVPPIPQQHLHLQNGTDPSRMVAVEVRTPESDKNVRQNTPNREPRKKSPAESPRPFVCDVCKKSFTKDTYLIQHLRIHTGERPFVCDLCNKTFTQSGHLVNHKRVHIGDRPFSCEICHKAFAHSRNLIRHRRAHTGERPYSCDLCGKSFLQSEHLNNHRRRIHEGQKLSCGECGKNFSHSFNLERHARIHTGERPFECGSCGKSFNQSTHLSNHMKCHEGGGGGGGGDGKPAKVEASSEPPGDVRVAGTQTNACVFPVAFPWCRVPVSSS